MRAEAISPALSDQRPWSCNRVLLLLLLLRHRLGVGELRGVALGVGRRGRYGLSDLHPLFGLEGERGGAVRVGRDALLAYEVLALVGVGRVGEDLDLVGLVGLAGQLSLYGGGLLGGGLGGGYDGVVLQPVATRVAVAGVVGVLAVDA